MICFHLRADSKNMDAVVRAGNEASVTVSFSLVASSADIVDVIGCFYLAGLHPIEISI